MDRFFQPFIVFLTFLLVVQGQTLHSCMEWSTNCVSDSECSSHYRSFVEGCEKYAQELNGSSTKACPQTCSLPHKQLIETSEKGKTLCPCFGLKASPWTSVGVLSLKCEEFQPLFLEQCGSGFLMTSWLSLTVSLVFLALSVP
eukprot:m.22944 g.22944  ORF g.22944 m.22944 type:complete len:143 (+) comp28427_c0_seq2:312-740(+)